MELMQPTESVTQQTRAVRKHNSVKYALLLMLLPFSLVLITFSLYSIVDRVLQDFSTLSTLVEILLFVVGLVGLIATLPGIVIGVILLIVKK